MRQSTDFGDFLKAHTPPQQVNVIVIDQFEELFTQSAAQPRDTLFNLLTQLPPFRSTRTHIIATMRADYLPELFTLRELYDIAKRGIDLRAMSVDELRQAIQQPLRVTYPDKDKRFQAESGRTAGAGCRRRCRLPAAAASDAGRDLAEGHPHPRCVHQSIGCYQAAR